MVRSVPIKAPKCFEYYFSGAGSRMGLSLVLNADVHEYFCSSTSAYGFKVVLHAPHELPQIDEYGTGIASGFESRIVTTPMITGTSVAVRRTPMRLRQCVYQDENFLTYYRLVDEYESQYFYLISSKMCLISGYTHVR